MQADSHIEHRLHALISTSAGCGLGARVYRGDRSTDTSVSNGADPCREVHVQDSVAQSILFRLPHT